MATGADLPVEERILRVLRELGIQRAHFAGRTPKDLSGLAKTSPEIFLSLTLMGPTAVNPGTVNSLASKLLVFNGDQGPVAERVRNVVTGVAGARLVTLRDYAILGWTDVVAERVGEIGPDMLDFLAEMTPGTDNDMVCPVEREGEIASISYRIQGSGPPLVLLPLFLAHSQWEALLPRLAERYCVITLGGRELGAVSILESRGQAPGYLRMMRTLIDETSLQPGEKVLEVGCGTGVLGRWLHDCTGGENPIVGLDISRFLLQEAAALARRAGCEEGIEFRQGSAESLPFADNSFDLTLSVTVIEEVDAERMLAEMARVTRPNGRVAVIARAMDSPFFMNLPISADLKAKVEAPGVVGMVEKHGCADASLYLRLQQAGLSQIKMFPQSPSFGRSDAHVLQFLEDALLGKLNREQALEWRSARSRAEAEGTFFVTWPHHCAVGTKR